MEDDEKPRDPAQPRGIIEPAVMDSIPSAVAPGTSANLWTWMALAAVGGVVVWMILSSPRQRHPAESGPTGLIPAEPPSAASVASPLILPPARAGLSGRPTSFSFGSAGAGDDYWQARLHSPMVIYNGAPGAPGSTALGGRGSSLFGMGVPVSPPLGPAAGGSRGSDTPSSGAPLPAHFTPSAAAASHSTNLGDREYLIGEGKLLDAVLETAVNSDHPGLLRALIADDIYGDSGRTVLLPRGSRLIGEYDSDVQQGQNRVFVLWQRAIRTDGIDIQLGSAGTDSLGETGLLGRVNHHFWTMFSAAALLSVIGAGASTVGVSAADQPNSAAEYREAVTRGFADAANNVLGQFVRIKPTITVRQGMPIKVFVARDLYFDAEALAQSDGIEVVP